MKNKLTADKTAYNAEAELKYRTLFEQSPDGIIILDQRGNILDFNTNAHVQLGYTREEFAKLRIADLDPVETKEEIEGKVREILKLEKAEHEVKHRTKQGEIRDVHVIVQKLVLSGETVFHAIWRDITERKRIDQSLQESEEKFRLLYEMANDGLYILRTDGKILDANTTAYVRLGYTKDELLTMNMAQVNAPAFAALLSGRIRSVIERGFGVFESVHLKKDGTELPVEINSRLMDYQGMKVLFSIIRDTTERKKMEAALRKSESLLKAVVESSTDAIYAKDIQGRYLLFNKAAASITSTGAESILDKDDTALFPSADAAKIMANDREIIASAKYVDYEETLTMKNGDQRILLVTKGPLIDEKQRVTGVFGISRDITSRKQSEDALKKSQNMLQAIIDAEPECVKLLDENANLIMMNKAGLAMIEVDSFDQVKGQCVCPLIASKDCDAFMNLTKRVFGGESGTLVFEMIGTKGRRLWLETHAVPFRNERDEIVALLGVTRDITESRRAEEALRRSEELVRSVLDNVDEGFIVVDREYRILTANRAYCKQVNISCDDAVGDYCYNLSHMVGQPCYDAGHECAVRKVFETGDPCMTYHEHRDAEGRAFVVEIKAFPLKDKSGAVTSAVESINDITERRLLEESRLKTQKLEAIGTLAGGIAHDFNNLLQGVFGYTSLAKLSIDNKEKSIAALEQVEKSLQMSVNLTNQLLTFSKGGKPLKKLINLRPVIESSAKFALSGSRSNFRIEIDDGLWQTEADEGQIGQVIQNIVLNADHAMPEGGLVEISAKNVQNPGKGLPQGFQEGNYVEISITDSGTGIPGKYIGKIFDPYFTTKEKGSGLGLATSYSIIKNHNGLLDVKSEMGRGTTFFIFIPAINAMQRESDLKPATAAPVSSGRILVMDDDQVILDVAGAMIKALGHDVQLASHGEEAIEKYRMAKEAGKAFDVVILDLTIRGGMGGTKTVRKLLDISPDVKAVVSSGYSEDTATTNLQDQGFKAFLKKPYTIDSLREVLNTLLNS